MKKLSLIFLLLITACSVNNQPSYVGTYTCSTGYGDFDVKLTQDHFETVNYEGETLTLPYEKDDNDVNVLNFDVEEGVITGFFRIDEDKNEIILLDERTAPDGLHCPKVK